MSQGTKRNIESATSASKKRTNKQHETTVALEDVLENVLENGFLHWSEILPLSGVNKACHCLIKLSPYSKIALERLLLELDSMAATHKHASCGKIYAPLSKRQCQCVNPRYRHREGHRSRSPYAEVDPRYLAEYDDLPLVMKCSKMTAFLTMLAINFRSHFDFDDLMRTRPDGVRARNEWIPNSGSTMMLNLAVLSFGGQDCVRDHYYFNDAFLGTGPIFDGGRRFSRSVSEIMHGMLRHDGGIDRFVRTRLYPSPKSQAILGLVLARKLCICAPLFDSIPLSAENREGALTLTRPLPRCQLQQLSFLGR